MQNDDRSRDSARNDRLKAALRENLRRRKAQARERQGGGPRDVAPEEPARAREGD